MQTNVSITLVHSSVLFRSCVQHCRSKELLKSMLEESKAAKLEPHQGLKQLSGC